MCGKVALLRSFANITKGIKSFTLLRRVMALEWGAKYSVQVKEIDEQHKKLFALINCLNDAINEHNVKEKVEQILKELLDYSVYHFETEEKYFDKYKYVKSVEHKAEHNSFKEKMLEFGKKFHKDEIAVSFELIDYLEDWLIDHMMHQDQQYVHCFKEHGLQ